MGSTSSLATLSPCGTTSSQGGETKYVHFLRKPPTARIRDCNRFSIFLFRKQNDNMHSSEEKFIRRCRLVTESISEEEMEIEGEFLSEQDFEDRNSEQLGSIK